ncbi:CaiB/BaiF CoA transferase family protein [Bradyrhizobium diversitatis]|uniref:CoA transferase n=1 Tax=Bradyrhizobium diversitatis TaxID=2755406 RepID=A0ABS0PBF2_9BRAD|nr:CoA transferase [Bradyrhizobium diversitatis]MBH5390643.1 CoA transferase [Bradyrhizobium diversitatis]
MDKLPLRGIQIVEMSHMIMGPCCGMILSQLGADVIKVEPPPGDKTRALEGMGTSFFPLFNRGKRSLVLDVATKSGRNALFRLLERSDVFIENFKDETIMKSGLDGTSLTKHFPRLIIAAHKGFLSGPYEHRPALDEVVQMMAGLAYMTGSREVPLRVGASVNDIMGGMFGVIGILAALREREMNGKGSEIRIGLFENCLFSVAQHIVQFQMTGVPVPPMPQRILCWPVYDIFTTRDDKRLFIAVTTDGQWKALCRTFGLDALLADPDLTKVQQRIDARPRLLPPIADRLRQHDLEYLMAKLDDVSIPFAPINAPEELLDDPHVRRPGGLVTMIDEKGHAIDVPTLPLEFDRASIGRVSVVPSLGGDTFSILTYLGYSESEIQELAKGRSLRPDRPPR